MKQNSMAGLELASLDAINAALRQWLDQVANVRVEGQLPSHHLRHQPLLRSAACSGQGLVLKVTPDRLYLYHQDRLVAESVRSYGRYQDFKRAEHVAKLLAQRRQARAQQLLSGAV